MPVQAGAESVDKGQRANVQRSRFGTDSTHWRTGRRGKT
jgi:hypothetical protein